MFEQMMKDAQDFVLLSRKLTDNLETGRNVLTVSELSQVKAVLDPLHAKNMTLSKELDAALAAAEKR
jgi:hypothetical protein